MPQNLPVRVCVRGYHLSPKIVSSVRGFRWKIPISMSLGVSSLPSLAACISAFRALRTKLSAARWQSCAPSCSLAARSRRANSLIAPGSRAPPVSPFCAPSKPGLGRAQALKDRPPSRARHGDRQGDSMISKSSAGNSRTAPRPSSSSSAKQIPKRWCAF